MEKGLLEQKPNALIHPTLLRNCMDFKRKNSVWGVKFSPKWTLIIAFLHVLQLV